jgi:hypothetical protein
VRAQRELLKEVRASGVGGNRIDASKGSDHKKYLEKYVLPFRKFTQLKAKFGSVRNLYDLLCQNAVPGVFGYQEDSPVIAEKPEDDSVLQRFERYLAELQEADGDDRFIDLSGEPPADQQQEVAETPQAKGPAALMEVMRTQSEKAQQIAELQQRGEALLFPPSGIRVKLPSTPAPRGPVAPVGVPRATKSTNKYEYRFEETVLAPKQRQLVQAFLKSCILEAGPGATHLPTAVESVDVPGRGQVKSARQNALIYLKKYLQFGTGKLMAPYGTLGELLVLVENDTPIKYMRRIKEKKETEKEKEKEKEKERKRKKKKKKKKKKIKKGRETTRSWRSRC